MSRFPPLADLGNRIVIMGPSTAGKSTLAQALSDRLGIPAIHLDQLHHQPHTDWVPRPREDFHALQRHAIARESWVMDGNYSALLPERLARATGAIVLDEGHWMRLARYGRRTLFERNRAGALEGNRDSIKWSMIHWVLVGSRHNGARYREFVDATGLPHVYCHSMGDLQGLYRHWGLSRR
jgi:adenylate kinase family enzyme